MDVINQALQNCKCDLKHTEVSCDCSIVWHYYLDSNTELSIVTMQVRGEFISLGGFEALLPYVCSTSKFRVLLGAALDIFLLFSSDHGMVCSSPVVLDIHYCKHYRTETFS